MKIAHDCKILEERVAQIQNDATLEPPYPNYKPAFNRSARVEKKLAKRHGYSGTEGTLMVIQALWYNHFIKMHRIKERYNALLLD